MVYGRPYTIKTMILNINYIYVSPGYNTTVSKLLILLPQGPDIKPIENLWVHLKKKLGKRSPTNKNDYIRFIREV